MNTPSFKQLPDSQCTHFIFPLYESQKLIHATVISNCMKVSTSNQFLQCAHCCTLNVNGKGFVWSIHTVKNGTFQTNLIHLKIRNGIPLLWGTASKSDIYCNAYWLLSQYKHCTDSCHANSIKPKYTFLRNINSFLRKWISTVHRTALQLTINSPSESPLINASTFPVMVITWDWCCNCVNCNMFTSISVATCDAICNLNKLPPGLHKQQLFSD